MEFINILERNSSNFSRLISHLNAQSNLCLPNEEISSPSDRRSKYGDLPIKCRSLLQQGFFGCWISPANVISEVEGLFTIDESGGRHSILSTAPSEMLLSSIVELLTCKCQEAKEIASLLASGYFDDAFDDEITDTEEGFQTAPPSPTIGAETLYDPSPDLVEEIADIHYPNLLPLKNEEVPTKERGSKAESTDVPYYRDTLDGDFHEIHQLQSVTSTTTVQIACADSVTEGLENLDLSAGHFSAELKRCHNIEHNLQLKGPFRQEGDPKVTLSFRHRYELERVSKLWNVPLRYIVDGQKLSDDYDQFWRWLTSHPRRNGFIPCPTTLNVWKLAQGRWNEPKSQRFVVLTGQLKNTSCDDGHFKLELSPLKLQSGCRFFRRFGSDRFMALTVPFLDNYCKCPEFRKHVAHWLARGQHRLLGRVWRPFHIEEIQRKGHKIMFFAVAGDDFQTSPRLQISPRLEKESEHAQMSVDALREWHVPWKQNFGESDCKLFYRIKLGLSSTYATAQLESSNIIRVPDKVVGSKVMNDGCARMSKSLGSMIRTFLEIEGPVPSCFQARIGGAKGVWMVEQHDAVHENLNEEVWIEISPSQLKIKPYPGAADSHPDPELCQFEVVGWSQSLRPSHLSEQLLAVLEDCGVPRKIFEQLLYHSMTYISDRLIEAVQKNDRNWCRDLLAQLGTVTDERFTENKWPVRDFDQAALLLESGFEPHSCSYLVDLLRQCLSYNLDSYIQKLRVPIQCSTSAYCIADPYGVLESNEICLSFSQRWDTGNFSGTSLVNTEVLVARHPAVRSCDIQKRKAVWKPELKHFVDVVIFPVKGSFPLADILSGGDYDGDRVWICWESDIVDSFINVEPLECEQNNGDVYLTHCKSPVIAPPMESFWVKMFDFYLERSQVGTCTQIHGEVCRSFGMRSGASTLIASIISRLLSGQKSGITLSPTNLSSIRKIAKSNIAHTTTADYLRQRAAEGKDQILTRYHQNYSWTSTTKVDDDIMNVWREINERGERELRYKNQRLLSNALKDLTQRILNIQKTIWTCYRKGHGREHFMAIVQEASQAVQDLQPNDFDHPLSHTWMNSKREWNRIRAAYIYYHNRGDKFAWFTVGRVLCWIKADGGFTFPIQADTLCYFRFSSSHFRRLQPQELQDEELQDGEPQDEEN